jgi:hypothetical protein
MRRLSCVFISSTFGNPSNAYFRKSRRTNQSSIGVWYSVVGTGGVLEVSLNATLILDFAVYEGESCDALTCVGSQNRAQFPLDWDSEEGKQYFIYVYAPNEFQKDIFDIRVSEVERPENDVCQDATPLNVNQPATGGTTNASSTKTGLELCGEIADMGFGGVWYSFVGNGDLILIGVTANEEGPLPFDSQLSVYSGPSCDDLTCVDGNDQGDRLGYSSAVSFTSLEGENYFILGKCLGDRPQLPLELLDIFLQLFGNSSWLGAVPR